MNDPAPAAAPQQPEMKPSSSLMAQATANGQANFTGKSLISYPTMSDKSDGSGLRKSETPDW